MLVWGICTPGIFLSFFSLFLGIYRVKSCSRRITLQLLNPHANQETESNMRVGILVFGVVMHAHGKNRNIFVNIEAQQMDRTRRDSGAAKNTCICCRRALSFNNAVCVWVGWGYKYKCVCVCVCVCVYYVSLCRSGKGQHRTAGVYTQV